MKFSPASLFLIAAIKVSTQQSYHSHCHVHRPTEARPIDFAMVDSRPPSTYTPALATQTLHDAVDSENRQSVGSESGASSYTAFCGGQKRATQEQIAYKGNVGVPGKYGCNMMLVQTAAAASYSYIIKFANIGGNKKRCECWNKIGPDGGIDGFFIGNQALSFNLPANREQHVAFDSNTQGGCACGAGAVPLTPIGQFASTWVEFDFGNESNNGWSGADASCLVAAKYGLGIPGLKVCDSMTCSIINPGGTGTNAYLVGMEAADGVGLNIAAGPAHLTATVDYQG